MAGGGRPANRGHHRKHWIELGKDNNFSSINKKPILSSVSLKLKLRQKLALKRGDRLQLVCKAAGSRLRASCNDREEGEESCVYYMLL